MSRAASRASGPQGEEKRYAESRFFRAHDAFLAADEPESVAVDQVDFLSDEDEVLGVEQAGAVRAYPIGALAYHHVVNDHLGGRPLLVAY